MKNRRDWPDNPTLPYLIHWSLRRDRLCEPSGCDDAIEIRDEQGFLQRREKCLTCPLEKLDRAIAEDPVLHRAFDFEFALTAGINITLDEIDVEEFRALKILRMERTRYESEEIKKARNSR